jgi:hypothetical protein
MSLFNRVVNLTIGSLNLSDLRVTFDIEKTITPSSNSAIVQAYNVSPNSRNLIRELDEPLQLAAGFSDDAGAKLIFTGDVVKIDHDRQPPDVVTKIEAGDGIRNLREQRTTVSFKKGTQASVVLTKIAGQLGLPIRTLPSGLSDEYLQGFAFTGSVKEALIKVTKKLDLEWSVQNGELQILERKGINSSIIRDINYNKGLLKEPQKLNDQRQYLAGDKENPGYKIDNLLLPDVEPGSLVNINAGEVSGRYRVRVVRHQGDNYSGDFNTILEVVEF